MPSVTRHCSPSKVRIFDGHSHRVTKRLLGMSEADLVFGQVGPSLGWVEFDVHRGIMHIIIHIVNRATRNTALTHDPAESDAFAGTARFRRRGGQMGVG
jgi:hypothetical protein